MAEISCRWLGAIERDPGKTGPDVGCLLKHHKIHCFGFLDGVFLNGHKPQGERWLRHFLVPWQKMVGENGRQVGTYHSSSILQPAPGERRLCMLKFY